MNVVQQWIKSSIGRKAIVALSGLLLCGFIFTHLVGNLLLLEGEPIYNRYAQALSGHPLLIPAEIVLALIFVTHFFFSIWLKIQNWRARPVGYAQKEIQGETTIGSRTMFYSGLLVLIFLVYHIATFKYGDQTRGLYRLVVSSFQNGPYAIFYLLAMWSVALHLSHGFQSTFQTLGLNHPNYTTLIKVVGWIFAVGIGFGFTVVIVWAYRFGGKV